MPDSPLFEIQGPDKDGNVYICSPEGRDVWCQLLGPVDDAAEVMSQWLASIDYDELEAKRDKLVKVKRGPDIGSLDRR